ncbi:zinc finger protein 2 homolog [Thrips palmi]|uniref:Zinc finger protein 2 homolog n=1 Tax=Thrips palmi TaxID=161013 RepID=A0A6P8Z6D7_THRPL|nr:zinc finger protein 2 homolog [Thrips palmi]
MSFLFGSTNAVLLAGSVKAEESEDLEGQDNGDDANGGFAGEGPPAATPQLRISSTFSLAGPAGDAGQAEQAWRQTRSRKARLDSKLGESGNKSRDKAAPRKHRAGNSKAGRHVCQVCGKDWPSASKLEIHARKHTGVKPYECDVCGKKFTRNGTLVRHMRVHTGEKPFECDVCGKKFLTKQSLDWHLRIHNGEKPFECHVCKKKFTQKGNLASHMRVHTGEKPYKCDVCGMKFSWRNFFCSTQANALWGETVECDVCKEKFPWKEGPDLHRTLPTGETPWILNCGRRARGPVSCPFGSTNAVLLAGSAKAEKLEGPEGQHCEEDADGSCHAEGPPAATPQLRISSTFSLAGPAGDAGQAEQAWRQTRSRKARLDSKLGESGNKSRDKAAPRKHRAGNSKAGRHVCQVCGKDWRYASELETHARKHTGEKPYECDVCRKKFTQDGTLDRHMRIHNGEKPYECDVCKKKFTQKSNLDAHMRVHSGEKPYECDVCKKRFRHRSHRAGHMRVMHTAVTR